MKIICFLFQACAPFIKVDYTMSNVQFKSQTDYKAIERKKVEQFQMLLESANMRKL